MNRCLFKTVGSGSFDEKGKKRKEKKGRGRERSHCITNKPVTAGDKRETRERARNQSVDLATDTCMVSVDACARKSKHNTLG